MGFPPKLQGIKDETYPDNEEKVNDDTGLAWAQVQGLDPARSRAS
jgi:hypothetical protein